LGSYALIGVLVGALLAGAVGDIIGRRRVMLFSYAWFAVFMGLTALSTTTTMFGIARFLTGLGVGALVGTTGAIVSEFAPAGKKNLCNAITYSGVPCGSLVAALLAILLLGTIGWRGLFWIGALPLVTLLPLAIFKMPESVAWLASRGRVEEARKVAAKTGMPMPKERAPTAPGTSAAGRGRVGYRGLFDRENWLPTVLLGLTSVTTLMLVYSLNTWLPELMLRAGFNTKGSLAFLLVLNGGAILSALLGSRVADLFGPKVVTSLFLLTGVVFIALLTLRVPLGVLLVFVALAGLGTSGTQILLFGFVANYYRTNVRAAGVAWCAGFGRLGGVGGPLVGGILIGAGLGVRQIFLVLAGVALLGFVFVLLVPMRRQREAPAVEPVEPTRLPGAVPDEATSRR
jgi:AAHS family benzoate transporter-like MFS transporter